MKLPSDYKKVMQETYDTIASDWDKKRSYPWTPVITFLDRQPKKDLLDIGCGTGRHMLLAQTLGYERIVGCDYAKGQMNMVKDMTTVHCELPDLPFKENDFSTIICIATLHHLLDQESQFAALKEMRRVLAEGGKLLLSNWFPGGEYVKDQKQRAKYEFFDEKRAKVTYDFHGKRLDRYYYFFDEEELKSLCKDAGFVVVQGFLDNDNLYLELM
jgi:ubiquinone/menaquinone biosynthesis C-methylase UbiE